jgi:protein TonB
MEKNAILHADFLDIIFEGRNKEYGAYELRRTYNKRMRISIAVMLSVVLLLCIGQLAGRAVKPTAAINFHDSVKLTQVDIPEPQMPPPPELKPPPLKQIETIKVTPPKIVPDDQVPETEMPPVEEQEDAKIDVVSKDGDKFDGVVAPPVESEGKGIVDLPKPKEDDNTIFTSVQIESSYPGGRPAWERFLKRNLHYPQQAQDNEIQGIVIVQFVVDKEGNVSNVIALSGPEELKAEAIRVIKKSGKWTPAIQNGNQVPSYKKQPIGFTLVIE